MRATSSFRPGPGLPDCELGQTTASIHAAVKKSKADMSVISAHLNLTMRHAAAAIDELAPKIWLYANSLYANSEDKVNTADFSAHHPSSPPRFPSDTFNK
jgi:hypothetical protein